MTAFESFLYRRDSRAVSAAGTGSLTLMYDAAAREQGFALRSTGTGSRPVVDLDGMLVIGMGVKDAALFPARAGVIPAGQAVTVTKLVSSLRERGWCRGVEAGV
ncbi:hypothetical protein [Actinotignum sp. GS-2025c]|uniref:hypothetical protein n=1 Tax=Actinotignum sp. GS-2025c TaxID=3427276 RepID=UPI003F455435